MSHPVLPNRPAPQKHLLFLDGLRGLAALYVVAHHAYLQVVQSVGQAAFPPAFHALTKWLLFGQMSVDVFIVLSGFCLMLPVVRGDGTLRGGLREFVKRRARRILPPYYAAVVLSLLLIWLVPALSRPGNALWAQSLPAFTPLVLVSHLFVVHNLFSESLHAINYVLWSVATEWQIYFVFALLLLPVWKRFGLVAALLTSIAAGYAPRVVFGHQLDGACFHFVILFAMGMVSAALAMSKEEKTQNVAASPVWLGLFLLSAAVFVALAGFRTEWLLAHMSLHDIVVGIATATGLLCLARASRSPAPAIAPRLVLRLLENRATVALGAFSYSLYLVHAPVLALVLAGFASLSLSPVMLCAASGIVGVVLCVGTAYGFYWLFERPFLSSGRVKETDRAVASAG